MFGLYNVRFKHQMVCYPGPLQKMALLVELLGFPINTQLRQQQLLILCIYAAAAVLSPLHISRSLFSFSFVHGRIHYIRKPS
jgi:hypothetical protein